MSKRIKEGFIETAMHYRQPILLICSLLIIFGIWALNDMPKNEFPSFTIRQGVVAVIYPGVNAEDIESQVTKPVERFLWTFKEIKKEKTYSQSKDGMAFFFIELNDNINNKDEFWSKFRHGMDNFKSQLPSGVLAVVVNDDFGETSALLIALESEQKTYREMNGYLDEMEDRLRKIPELGNVRRYGVQKEQISVYLDPNKTATYGIGSGSLNAAIFAQGFTAMSGSLDNQKIVAPLYIKQNYMTELDIANQIVYSDPAGHIVRLKDIATVVREYPSADSYIKSNGKKCVMLSIEMNPGNNIVQFGDEVNKILDDYKYELPEEVNLYKITDQSKVVGDSIFHFLEELLIAILAVVIVIMLLMPFKIAAVAASSIPITIFISLGFFYLFGLELNTVTLAALIVTLGMIVDNSIVIIDCYVEKLEQGMSRWHAAASSAKEFLNSIISATLAISLTFFPFLITMKGMFHDFVFSFPIAISIVLFFSLLVAVLIIPYMQYYYIRSGIKQKEGKLSFLDVFQGCYNKVLAFCFHYPKSTIAFGILVIVGGGLLFTILPQKLMPIAERDQFAIEITLPEGTAIEKTALVADSMENILKKDPKVKSITSFIGCGSPRFHTTYAPSMGGFNFAQFIVNTGSNEETISLLDKYAPIYTDYFPEAKIRFKQLEYSDAIYPIEIRLAGENLDSLQKAGDLVVARMIGMDNLSLVRTNFLEKMPGISIKMNDDEATRLGITKAMASLGLASQFSSGLPVTNVWENDYSIGVVLKNTKSGMQNIDDLNNTYLPSVIPGNRVPLRQIASANAEWNIGQIVRRNGVRTLSVTADVNRNVNLTNETKRVHDVLDNMELPDGVTLTFGGAEEKDSENIPQIVGGLISAIFIIFFVLLWHFKKIKLALLIIVCMTFCIPGGAIGIGISGYEMSLTAVLGFVSLMGILTRNGIIMVDYAENLRNANKMSVFDAIKEAAQRRMRPIFLTSAAASMGVLPMLIGGSSMWGPMGAVIFFGTLVSFAIIITLLPILYWIFFKE
ncbi:MAG: efflux RND transporter permease subunit [Paludibacteraceae bacterium]